MRSWFGMDESWQPISDANQALMVAEKVAELSQETEKLTWSAIAINNDHGKYLVEFETFFMETHLFVNDDSFTKALVLVSLLAYDSLKEVRNENSQ